MSDEVDITDPLRKRLRPDPPFESILTDLSFESDSNDKEDANNVDDIELISTCEKENDKELNIMTSQKKRNKFVWVTHSEWEDLDAALDYLENEGFVHYDSSDLKCGQKFYFRCKLIPKEQKIWCAQRYTVFLPSNNTKYIILSNQLSHDHDQLLEGKTRPPSDEMVEFIRDLFMCNTTKIAEVIHHLDNARAKRGLFQNEKNPERRQIEYMLRKYRCSQAPSMVKLGDMIEWCDQHKEFPSNVDEAFIFNMESSSFEEELSFRFAFSTPRLLETLLHLKTICIDATYKLNWLGFPLMVFGTVDRTKRFHPFVYACCSHERAHDYKFIFESTKAAIEKHFTQKFEPETLIADGADAIRNAFYASFATALLDIMCFSHVIRNCQKRPFTSKNNKQLIIDDIRRMQSAPNSATFNMMARLFCEKWQHIEQDFVLYFKKEWLGVHCNWFEGAAHYTASTNNGQESHNAVIKKKVTLRRRLPMNQFLVCMKDMTADISKQFAKGEREIATEPNVKRDVYEKAELMVMNNFKAFKAKSLPNSHDVIFSVPSSKCATATESYYKTLVKTTWASFDEFIVHGFHQFYVVKFSSDNWNTQSTCTCIAFFKQHMCKHIVAIGIRLKVIDPPSSANPVHLAATRRKVGRPKRTAKALSMQT